MLVNLLKELFTEIVSWLLITKVIIINEFMVTNRTIKNQPPHKSSSGYQNQNFSFQDFSHTFSK